MYKKKKLKKIFITLTILLLITGIILFLKEYQVELLTEPQKEKKGINSKPTVKDNDVKNSIFKSSYSKAQKIVSEMSLKEKVGQLFLVRYYKNDIEYLSNFYPGGYILFAKDFENHTKATIKEELTENQKLNKYPLIIGIDEEGGFVTRVSRYTSFRNERFQSPKSYYEAGGLELLEETETEKANLLKSLGINLNLAPVADISTNPNDFIYNRSLGYDAKKTSELIAKMVELSNKNKINSCLKHFPGYGNNTDTHTGIAIDNRSYDSFVNHDFLPFKAGIEANVPSIFVSHNIIKALDENYPASLSKKVIGELRNTLGFTGIIMTDDLAMDAVKSYISESKAATMAINAGNDMIITSDFLTMYNEVLASIENGEIKDSTIDKAVLRIIAWKYSSNLF